MFSAPTGNKQDDTTGLSEQFSQTTLSNSNEAILRALKPTISNAPTPHNTPSKTADDLTPVVPVLRAPDSSTDNKDNLDITTERSSVDTVTPTPFNSPAAPLDTASEPDQVPPLRIRAASTGGTSSKPNLSPNSLSAAQLLEQTSIFEPISPLPSSLSPKAADAPATAITLDSPSGETTTKRLNFN